MKRGYIFVYDETLDKMNGKKYHNVLEMIIYSVTNDSNAV